MSTVAELFDQWNWHNDTIQSLTAKELERDFRATAVHEMQMNAAYKARSSVKALLERSAPSGPEDAERLLTIAIANARIHLEAQDYDDEWRLVERALAALQARRPS